MTLPPKFMEYTERRGIKLLKDDIKFLEKCLRKTPSALHRDALLNYVREFELGMGVCKNNVAKMNSGRFRANTWMRTTGINPPR
jgi:hypothetical protein